MNNPFATIDARLSNIEALLLDLKHLPKQHTNDKQNETFLTITDASLLLDLTTPTLYGKVSRKEIPYIKRGKRLYFSEKELREYLLQGKIKTAAQLALEAQSYTAQLG